MSYKNHLFLVGSLLMGGLLTCCQFDAKQVSDDNIIPVSTNRMLNPIAPPGVYIADPEVRQMPDGRVYVYGSRDEPGNAWCSRSYNVLSSSDLVNWSVEQFSFATEGPGKQVDYTDRILYAPDCIHHGGKYYLYYCLAGGGDDEGVAVSSSPYGPFKDGKVIEGIKGIDPSVFIDDDGQAYLFWGQGYAKGAKLSKDMLSIEGAVHDSLLTYETHFFNEGSSVRKEMVFIILCMEVIRSMENPTVRRWIMRHQLLR